MISARNFPGPDGNHPTYSSWEQVAGYFDGDGNVRMEVGKFVLRIGVRFADTWRPQLESIRSFLVAEGLVMGKVSRDHDGVGNRQAPFRLDVGENTSVVKLMEKLVGLCVKKRKDLEIALDYLHDRITGDEAVKRFNEQFLSGRRRGKIHASNMPYPRSHGLRHHEIINAKKAREAHRVEVEEPVQAAIISDRLEQGLEFRKLSEKYGLSYGVLKRILRENEARTQGNII
jgi:hypothetical protein